MIHHKEFIVACKHQDACPEFALKRYCYLYSGFAPSAPRAYGQWLRRWNEDLVEFTTECAACFQSIMEALPAWPGERRDA